MRCVKVLREEAEAARYRLNAARMVRKDHRILESGESVLIPIVDGVSDETLNAMGYEIGEAENPWRQTFRDPIGNIRGSLHFTEELKSLLPHKWEHLGDVVIVRLPDELTPFRQEIGEAYATELNAKAVLQEVGVIEGVTRRPKVINIFGTDSETLHREGDILYRMDPAKVMFSSGNFEEKRRMGALNCKGETIVDMFAGIGYFTLPLARRTGAERIIACEINPESYHYLVENVRLNMVEDIVEPVLGDNRDLPGECFADRILMGYVGSTRDFLSKALKLIKPGGKIHYHDTVGIEGLPSALLSDIRNACGDRKHRIDKVKVVKSYGPCTLHTVVDITIMD
ncbi:MAG TPA: class I SAM-dependent methyltransferase family protein [Methanomassiliicoccales archaeon]|nr:class I SAM-dependent methyltransferase family protein [Methanomassiliicoccales archaeon]